MAKFENNYMLVGEGTLLQHFSVETVESRDHTNVIRATILKDSAAVQVLQGSWCRAHRRYGKALRLLVGITDPELIQTVERLKFHIHNNMAQCCLKFNHYYGAICSCSEALKFPAPTSVGLAKLYYRYATAELGLGEFEKALELAQASQKAAEFKATQKLIENIQLQMKK